MDEFSKLLDDKITSTAKQIINDTLEPVRVLKDYENVDVLTFDEACKVLRLSESELKNAIAGEAVPFVRVGKSVWRFPKRLLVDYLLGVWRKGEEVKPLRNVSNNIQDKIDGFAAN